MTDKIDLEELLEGLPQGPFYSCHYEDTDDITVIFGEIEGDLDGITFEDTAAFATIHTGPHSALAVTNIRNILQRAIAAEKKAQSERERADRAEAEVERFREVILSAVESLVGEAGFSDVIADDDHPDHETWCILTRALLAQSNKEG